MHPLAPFRNYPQLLVNGFGNNNRKYLSTGSTFGSTWCQRSYHSWYVFLCFFVFFDLKYFILKHQDKSVVQLKMKPVFVAVFLWVPLRNVCHREASYSSIQFCPLLIETLNVSPFTVAHWNELMLFLLHEVSSVVIATNQFRGNLPSFFASKPAM